MLTEVGVWTGGEPELEDVPPAKPWHFRIRVDPDLSYASPMPKPVVMSVDDDPDVLRVLGRDLRSRYGRPQTQLSDIERYLLLGPYQAARAEIG